MNTQVKPADDPTELPAVDPLAPDSYRVTFTAPASLVAKLEDARDLLAHAVPDGDIAVLVERGLDVLLETTLKRRFGGAAARGAAALPPPVAVDNSGRSRYIPMALRAAVWIRDEGRCTYVSPDGHCCGARRFLELHHPDPYGFGAGHDMKITLRCRAHNLLDARQVYGDACIDQHISVGPRSGEQER